MWAAVLCLFISDSFHELIHLIDQLCLSAERIPRTHKTSVFVESCYTCEAHKGELNDALSIESDDRVKG